MATSMKVNLQDLSDIDLPEVTVILRLVYDCIAIYVQGDGETPSAFIECVDKIVRIAVYKDGDTNTDPEVYPIKDLN